MKGKKEERETAQEGEGCVGSIKGSWRPPGVSHLHPLIHRALSASASPINMESLQENESLLIYFKACMFLTGKAIQMRGG